MKSTNHKRKLSSRGSELPDPAVPSDKEVEEYMRMAARMVYDIIQDWRERHPTAPKQGEKQSEPDHD